MPSVAAIRSEGDLEVVLLHETHGFLAGVIHPELYSVVGTEPEQNVAFQNGSLFNLFLILVIEFFAEGVQSACIDQKFQNWSLLKGLRWLCEKYPGETEASGLDKAVSQLESWAAKEVQFQFWCPDVNAEIVFPLKNEQLISFGANTAKHHLIRLSSLLDKLQRLCVGAGYDFAPGQLPAVLACMADEARNRLRYHASHMLELLGEVFLALNNLIKTRFDKNPTNRVSEMVFPAGLTSDVFRNLYGSVMVFQCYDDARIRRCIPTTTRYLKMRY